MQFAGSFFDQTLRFRKVNGSDCLQAFIPVSTSTDTLNSAKTNDLLSGGGTITYTSAGDLSWTQRLIVIAGGNGINQSIQSSAGYFDIYMPPVGTVIPAQGGFPSVTVTAEGIRVPPWSALYYKLKSGGSATDTTAFSLVSYTNRALVSSDMVLIAVTNSDNGTVKLGTGFTLFRNNRSFYGGTPQSNSFYPSTAAAIADAALPVGANYIVIVGGAKQLYIK
jgi:hypothetical protein